MVSASFFLRFINFPIHRAAGQQLVVTPSGDNLSIVQHDDLIAMLHACTRWAMMICVSPSIEASPFRILASV